MTLFKQISLFALLSLLFWGCPEESENLVNPPPQAESVYIRFVNLAGDGQSRKLVLDNLEETSETLWGSTSPAINPPSDSVKLAVFKNGAKEFEQERKARYARDLVYSYFALPSAPGDSIQRVMDTIITMVNSSVIPLDSRNAYVKAINAVPNKDWKYTIRFGCPNGDIITSQLEYRRQSVQLPIRSGRVPVSLIKHNDTGKVNIGLFEFEMQERGQYIFIVRDDMAGGEEFWLLDEMDTTANAMKQAMPIQDRTAYIRTVNFSASEISVFKDGEIVEENIQPNSIGSFNKVTACATEILDEMTAFVAGDTASKNFFSLEVLEDYTVMVFDSANSRANNMMVIEPVRDTIGSKAQIRVIHQAHRLTEMGITVTVAARRDAELENKYKSGEVVTSRLSYGNISPPILVKSGYAPIGIFASTEPARYITNAIANLESGKSYILVVTTDDNGKEQISLIKDEMENTQIEYEQSGVILEVVHAVPGLQTVDVDVDSFLDDAKLFFTSSLSTIVTEGQSEVSVNGKKVQIDAQLGKRQLVIATGNAGNIELIYFSSDPMGATSVDFRRRFINASFENPFIGIKFSSEEADYTHPAIQYGTSTDVRTLTLTNSQSIFVFNAQQDKLLQRFDLPDYSLSKNYIYIFTGDAQNGYALIEQQEFSAL